MADRGTFPSYECIADSEIDGDENRFRVAVRIAGEVRGEGIARSKRLAERSAATAALVEFDRARSGADVGSESDPTKGPK